MQDEIRPKGCQCGKKNVADLGTKTLSIAVFVSRCLAPGLRQRGRRRCVEVNLQDVGMSWALGSMQNKKDPDVRDGPQDNQRSVRW